MRRTATRFAAVLVSAALGACASTPVVAPPATPPPVAKRARRTPQAPPSPIALEPASHMEEPRPAPAAPSPAAPSPETAAERGVASYYADSLAGHRTANGERYRPELATCAHLTHRFGTTLVVTAVASGRSATCRVNDRGPWVKGRVLDVSKSVAKTLGMIGAGVLEVRIEVAQAEAE